jgi:predicted Zn-dependent peptidase
MEQRELCKDTHQTHVAMGARSYCMTDDRQVALSLLANILGGPGMNSRLNIALRERRGLVYNVETSLTGYTDTGVFCIYFGTEERNTDTCLRIARNEIKRLCTTALSSSQLAHAKRQYIGQAVVAADNSESNALAMAKMFLHCDRYSSPEQLAARVEAVTADDLLTVANEIVAVDNLSTLIYK